MKILQATLALVLTIGITSRLDAATASWDPNTEPDIAGYLLSYGTEPGEHTSTIDVGNVTSFQFHPEPGRRYYVVVRAYNTKGYLSEKSSQATIDIPASVPPPAPGSYPPPPPPAGASLDNTLVPPATQIVDTTGGIWTLGANNATLRDGVQLLGWSGTKLLWYNASVYNLGLDGSWYRWDSSGTWVNLNTSVQPGTTTSWPSTSPDNTLVPPATQVVDAAGAVWTISRDNLLLRNGTNEGGGRGTMLLWYSGVVYTFGMDDSWYRWNNDGANSGWLRLNTTTQPGTQAPPGRPSGF